MRSRRHHVPALPEPAAALQQERWRASHQARLEWLMPGATPLTRAITATILEAHGLLEADPVPRARHTPAAVGRTRARTLRQEVTRLCTQAAALCRESALLCKARPASASSDQTPSAPVQVRLEVVV